MNKLRTTSDCCHFEANRPTAVKIIPVTAHYIVNKLRKHFGEKFPEKKVISDGIQA